MDDTIKTLVENFKKGLVSEECDGGVCERRKRDLEKRKHLKYVDDRDFRDTKEIPKEPREIPKEIPKRTKPSKDLKDTRGKHSKPIEHKEEGLPKKKEWVKFSLDAKEPKEFLINRDKRVFLLHRNALYKTNSYSSIKVEKDDTGRWILVKRIL